MKSRCLVVVVSMLALACAPKSESDDNGGRSGPLQTRLRAQTTVTMTATETGTATHTSTATGTATQTMTVTATATATVTAPGSGTATVTRTATATTTTTAIETGTVTATGTRTVTFTGTRTGTAPGTYQQIYTFTGTITATSTGIVYYASWPHSQGNTATATTNQFASGTAMTTVTRTVTSPFNGTETKTQSATVTGSGTKTGTATVTVTATVTTASTNAGTGTRTVTATGTATGTATQTWTATWTTQVTQTVTNTNTSTVTNTNTVSNTATLTNTSTLTHTTTETSSTTGTSTTTNTSTSTSTNTTTRTTTNTNTDTVTTTVTLTMTGTDTSVDAGTGDGGAGSCLENWRSTTCGEWCLRETQEDRRHCTLFLDCYFQNGVGPTDNPDGTCGVNHFNYGMAPKIIADQVYQCLACPGTSPVTSCAGLPDTTPCTDGNPCTTNDRCINGACALTTPVTCPAQDQCHDVGTCNPSTGCSNPKKADGTTCNDGNPCTQVDQCQDGVCGGTPYLCDDGLNCTEDSCNGDGTCTFSVLVSYCAIDGVCYTNAVINPGNQCQICDSTQPSAWSNQTDGISCEDGNACTSNDTCQAGVCASGPLSTGPAAPGDLSASSSPSGVTLRWAPSQGATSYNVMRGTASGGPYAVIGSSTSSGYLDASLASGSPLYGTGQVYYYVVTAVDGCGESGASNEAAGNSAAVLPPRPLPAPPQEVGCYFGTADGWTSVPCASADQSQFPPAQLGQQAQPSINSVSSGGNTLPFQFAQIDATMVTLGAGAVHDQAQGDGSLSLQLNTNHFSHEVSPGVTHNYAMQFLLRTLGQGNGTFLPGNTICISPVDLTVACGPTGSPCDNSAGYNFDNHCLGTLTDPTGQGNPIPNARDFQPLDFATIGVSTFQGKIGLVVQLSWSGANDPFNGFGLYSIVAPDDLGLGSQIGNQPNWSQVTGTFVGWSGGSTVDFPAGSSVLTRIMAGTCVDGPGPVDGIPWPGACQPVQTPLLPYTATSMEYYTIESNNLQTVDGPTALVSYQPNIVYTEFLASTDATCQATGSHAYVMDTPEDTGVVPTNTGSQPLTNSPDILIVPDDDTSTIDVNTPATNSVIDLGRAYRFYVRVHNDFGCTPVNGVKVKLFMTDPSGAQVWSPGNITNGYVGDVTIGARQAALLGPFTWTGPTGDVGSLNKAVIAAVQAENEPAPDAGGTMPLAPTSNQVAQRNVRFLRFKAAPHTPLAGFQFRGIQENIKYLDAAGDICEVYFTKDDPGVDWHFSDITDQVGGPPAALDSGMAAFETTFDSPRRQHVFYQSAESPSHIYELMFGNAQGPWTVPPRDLTREASAPPPKVGSPLAGYQSITDDHHQLHVDFIDEDGNVYELWYDSNVSTNWQKMDLWDDAQKGDRRPPPTMTRPVAVNLVGYLTPYNGQKHVIFINSNDGKIYEYYLGTDDSHWRFAEIPTPGASPITNSPLNGYVTTFEDTHQQHVNYLGGTSTDVHLYELMIAEGDSDWNRPNDLNTYMNLAPGTGVSASSSLTGYQTTYNNQQHVDFIDTDHHVQELVLKKGSTAWSSNDLTKDTTDIATGGKGPPSVPLVAPGSHLTGYQTTWNNLQHVVFTTSSNELYELYYLNDRWNGNYLTPKTPESALSFWPVAGTYSGTIQVEIRDQAVGRTIHYTTDGSTPTDSSTRYTGPITVSTTTTIKALAISSGNDASSRASSTYSIVLGNATTPVAAVVTTNDGAHKMDPHSGASFLSGTGSTNVIHVDESVTYQEIEGFGASITDTSAVLLYQASQSDRDKAMQDLFSPTLGIGLSFIRNPMGASDFTPGQPYTYADYGLANFSISHDLDSIIPLVHQAKSLNSNLKIMASPWSPPVWMKTPSTMWGKLEVAPGVVISSMLVDTDENYRAFANYFVNFIQEYAKQNILIDYISLQNEPEYPTPDYPGMVMHSDKQILLLKEYVLHALSENGLNTKVLVFDYNWDNPDYPETVLSDPTIRSSTQVAGVAWHGYSGTPGAMTRLNNFLANQNPPMGQYVTEHSGDTQNRDQTQADFEEIIHTMRNWARAYVKWNIAEDENNGPRVKDENGNEGGERRWTPIVVVNSASHEISYSLQYYTMGHFSKYVRPGATRIYSSNAPGLVSAAFRNTDGSKAMVVYNETANTRTFQVQWGSQVLTYSLPSKSGATLTWNGTQSGSYTMAANAQIQASSYSDVANLETDITTDTDRGYYLGYATGSSVATFKNVAFGTGLTSLDARVANDKPSTTIECHLDSPTGTLISTISVPQTGGWQSWVTVNGTVTSATGVHDLYLVFRGEANLNWFKFK